MHAIAFDEPGGPEVMRWQEVDDPFPTIGEVLIEVAASAVNRADVLQRQGFYPPPTGASPFLGLECAGTIVELGAGVEGVGVGDQVCAVLAGGGYAERVAVPVGQVMPLPFGLDLLTSASLPEVACTAWSNLINVANLGSSDTVLIHGGSGGVGTHAIQLAKALGATVATTVGSPEKARFCRELGADVVCNYRDEDFVAKVRYATAGRGADIVLDNMGAKYLSRNIQVLAPGGRLVVIGMQGGTTAEVDLGALLRKRASIHATSLRSRPLDEKSDICQALMDCVWPLIESETVRPIIDTIMPIAEVAEAHRRMEDGAHIGKIVLTV